MLTLGTTGAIHLAVEPVDGRKGIDGLAGVVTAALGRDPAGGDLFVFKNRRGDRLKILAWQGDGFALYLRRLERGTFAFPAATGAELAVTPAQLAMILGGLDPVHARHRKRYATPAGRPPNRRPAGRVPGGMTAPATPSDPRDAELAVLRATVAELLGVVADLRNQVEAQQAHIHKLVKLTFGPRSERAAGPTLFDAVTPADPAGVPPASSDAPASPPASVRPGHGRRRKPADLPRERVVIDLSDAEKACPCCSAVRVRVGQDVSERLDYRPASLFVREVVRPTYVCRRCESAGYDPQFRQARLPAEVVPRGGVGPGLLAHTVVAKFVDHLPLNRQEAILAREGWPVPRSTLCDHLRACGRTLDPLYRLMAARVKMSHAIHADETPVALLKPRRSAYAWVYLGDATHPYTVFDLTAGRRKEYPEAFLAGYGGFVHADAYAGYNRVHAGVRHVGCWMHARRNFVEARDSDPVKAAEALAFVRTLYAVEREAEAAGLTGPAVADDRRTRASPVLDRFADWLEAEHRTARPKSPLGAAVAYARNGWPSLTRYVTDGRLAIDNGPAERAVRPLAVGRRNWLFVGGDGGLATAAVLLSVCASARRHGVNTWSYLRDLFDRLPAVPSGSDLSAFLPDAWAKSHLDR